MIECTHRMCAQCDGFTWGIMPDFEIDTLKRQFLVLKYSRKLLVARSPEFLVAFVPPSRPTGHHDEDTAINSPVQQLVMNIMS